MNASTTPCMLYYIVNRKWMHRFFETREAAVAYAEKRINESNFVFREIAGRDRINNVDFEIKSINGKGLGC